MNHHKRLTAVLILIVAGQLVVACAGGAGSPVAVQSAPAQPAVVQTPVVQPTIPTASSNHAAGTSPTIASGSLSPTGSAPASTSPTPAATATSTNSDPAAVTAPATPAGSRLVPRSSDLGESVHATRACQLVTQQDAKGALGSEPPKGLETDLSGGITTCSYLVGASSLQLSLTPTGGKNALDLQLAHLPKDNPAVAVVTGIGDDAFTQALGTRAAVNFDKGDAMVVMGLNLAGATAPPLAQLEAVAKAAAERL
jgi:hypothetical protein